MHMRAKFGCGPTAVSKKVSFKYISKYNMQLGISIWIYCDMD